MGLASESSEPPKKVFASLPLLSSSLYLITVLVSLSAHHHFLAGLALLLGYSGLPVFIIASSPELYYLHFVQTDSLLVYCTRP